MSHPLEPLAPGAAFKLTEAQETELRAELASVIDEQRADTAEFQRQLIIQRRLYELKARRKTWPWPGAANFIIPIIRFVVDHYKSRIQRVFRQSPHLWHGTVIGSEEIDESGFDWKQIAEDAAEVSNYLSKDPSHINIHEFVDTAADFLVKDGTVPIKVHFVNETKPRGVVNADTGKLDVVEEPYEKRVRWDAIDLQRTIWTVGGSNPDDMPVFGHWMEFTRGQLRALAVKHKLDREKINRILTAPDDPWFVEEERILDEEMGVSRNETAISKTLNIFRIHELTVEHQLADDAPPRLITVWWHHGTSTVLRVFDPQDYAKPYEVARFISRGKQFLASGIAEALRVLNLGSNAVVNQTTDAQTIANASGFLYKSGGRLETFIAQSGVFPGVRLPVDEDVTKEFDTFQLGSGGTAVSLQLLNFYLQMAEMIGKVGPSQLGNVSSGSRVAASVGLGVMQEGNQMIDSVIDRFRDVIDRCQLRTLLLYANHMPEVFDMALPHDRATQLLAAIRDPEANFPLRIRVNLNLASAAANNEKDKQDLIVLANFMFNVYNKITETAPILAAPQAPPEFKQIVAYVYKGMSEVISRLLSKFDQFKDPDAALPPEISDLINALAGLSGESGSATVFPRVAAPTGPPQAGLEAAATGVNPLAAATPEGLIASLAGGRR